MKRGFDINVRVTAMLLGLLATMTSHAEPAHEYKLKAAFLYNFVQLTEWPKTADASLRLCIVGQDPIGVALQEIEGAEVGDRRIKIVHLNNLAASDGCETLYLGELEPLDVKVVLSKLAESPILTISDNLDLARSGVMITMFPENRRLVFRLNAESAKHAHLTLSSRLLRLARYVD